LEACYCWNGSKRLAFSFNYTNSTFCPIFLFGIHHKTLIHFSTSSSTRHDLAISVHAYSSVWKANKYSVSRYLLSFIDGLQRYCRDRRFTVTYKVQHTKRPPLVKHHRSLQTDDSKWNASPSNTIQSKDTPSNDIHPRRHVSSGSNVQASILFIFFSTKSHVLHTHTHTLSSWSLPGHRAKDNLCAMTWQGPGWKWKTQYRCTTPSFGVYTTAQKRISKIYFLQDNPYEIWHLLSALYSGMREKFYSLAP